MSNPKFSVGEAVMIRSESSPEYNCDFAIILDSTQSLCKNIDTGDISFSNVYVLDRNMYPPECGMSSWWSESALRPIPKEKPNGICAFDYVNNLCGVSA